MLLMVFLDDYDKSKNGACPLPSSATRLLYITLYIVTPPSPFGLIRNGCVGQPWWNTFNMVSNIGRVMSYVSNFQVYIAKFIALTIFGPLDMVGWWNLCTIVFCHVALRILVDLIEAPNHCAAWHLSNLLYQEWRSFTPFQLNLISF